jgi:lipid A ethanolaminephosphotransferase
MTDTSDISSVTTNKRFIPPQLRCSLETLCVLTAGFCLLINNQSFWQRLTLALGSPALSNLMLYAQFALLALALLSLLFLVVTLHRFAKPVLSLILLSAAIAAYFMDHYGVIVDRHALQSMFESDARESMEWLSTAMIWPIVRGFLLPALLLMLFVDIKPRSWRAGFIAKLTAVTICIGLAGFLIGVRYQSFASVARNHTVLRDLLTPWNVLNATRAYIKKTGRRLPDKPTPVASDAVKAAVWKASTKPKLVVIVVGESVRAASFGLLGYERNTTPELAKKNLLLFEKTLSCGTNTATSVPCMFSHLTRSNFDDWQVQATEDLLDVYQRIGFDVVWIDNNTGSKGVARRTTEFDVAHETDPALCNADGCHDEILLRELDARLPKISRDSVLVLHMLGSHGPAYFQRYPKAFAQFQPICESVELQNCSTESVKNSYDNTVHYTDYVVAKMIDSLQSTSNLDSALIYVSDHGESTGESGFFLHGAPYAIAPKEQTEVPMFFWLGDSFKQWRGYDSACGQDALRKPTSHDAVFPMMLNLLAIQSNDYRADLDPFAKCFNTTPQES